MVKTLEGFMERLKKIDPAKVVGPKNEIKPWEEVIGEVDDNVKIIFGLMKEFGQEIIKLKESCSEEKLRDVFSPEAGQYISRSVEYKIAEEIMREEIRRNYPEVSNYEFALRKGWKLVKFNPEKMVKHHVRSNMKNIIEDTVFSCMESVIDIDLIDRKDFSTLIEDYLDKVHEDDHFDDNDFEELRLEVLKLFTEKVRALEIKSKKKVIKEFTDSIQNFSISFSHHVIQC